MAPIFIIARCACKPIRHVVCAGALGRVKTDRLLRKVMHLKLHKPTKVIGYSLPMCARYVDLTNPGRSNLVFRSKPIAEAEMSNRLIIKLLLLLFDKILRYYYYYYYYYFFIFFFLFFFYPR